MVFSVGAKQFVRDGNVIVGTTFGAKSNSFFFADMHLGERDKCHIWRWNERDRYTKLCEMSGALYDLRLSPSEDALALTLYQPKREARLKLSTLSFSANK